MEDSLPCPETPRWAMRLAPGAAGEQALAAYLQQHGMPRVAKFAPKDDDELNEALSTGRFERVIFPDLEELFEVVFGEHAHLDRWAAAKVRIEIANQDNDDSAEWRGLVLSAYQALSRRRRRERRDRIIAAIILSVLALASVTGLLWMIPPAR